jgi:adenosylmethionine-8-amino-7-oxononanoate aminotransferase
LICDEVATAFGRTGKMFACEHERVSPDLMAIAKGLTGGYLPLAATLTTDKIYSGFLHPYSAQKTFFHGHSYTGNPLACAVALENLKVFKKEKTLKNLQPKIKLLSSLLRPLASHPHVLEIRQQGFMVGIELVKNKTRKLPYAYNEKIGIQVCRMARDHGALLRPLGPVIVLMPPLCITEKELRSLVKIVEICVNRVTLPS